MTPVIARLFSLWRNLVHRNRVDRDLDEELRAAFELLVDEKVRSGMPLDDARRAARLELGSLESLRGAVRDARAGAGVDTLIQDIRYSLRMFRRAPGFTAVHQHHRKSPSRTQADPLAFAKAISSAANAAAAPPRTPCSFPSKRATYRGCSPSPKSTLPRCARIRDSATWYGGWASPRGHPDSR